MAAGLCDHWQRDESDKGPFTHSLRYLDFLFGSCKKIFFLSWDEELSVCVCVCSGSGWSLVITRPISMRLRRSVQGRGGGF